MGTLGGLGLTTSVKQLHLQNHQMPYLQNAFQINCEFVKLFYLPLIEMYGLKSTLADSTMGRFFKSPFKSNTKDEDPGDSFMLPSIKAF